MIMLLASEILTIKGEIDRRQKLLLKRLDAIAQKKSAKKATQSGRVKKVKSVRMDSDIAKMVKAAKVLGATEEQIKILLGGG